MKRNYLLIAFFILIFFSCRKDPGVIDHGEQPVSGDTTLADGFYLLNEGNMGSNKASLDFFDYKTNVYKSNIYNEINPTAPKELGDVGNDIQIYGSKLYAVINNSNKVEVMGAKSAKRLGQIDIVNCRYITFANGKAYVSSYNSGIGDPNAPNGIVAEVDTSTLKILREVNVGRQPEEMAAVNNKLYVANSGGYSPPDYERTVSVIDLNSFTEIKRIDVAINLNRVKKDKYGDIYVSSRGDYYGIPSNLYVIDTKNDVVKDSLGIGASDLWINGDSAYVISVDWSYIQNANVTSYALINVKTNAIISKNFITDGSQSQIQIPYGVAVNPVNNDIYVTDAKDYVVPGTLNCYDKNGKKKWSVTTGDIPGHFAFLPN